MGKTYRAFGSNKAVVPQGSGALALYLGQPGFNVTELWKLFPHGRKAIFMDEMVLLEGEQQKVVSLWKFEVGSSKYFADHFPASSGLPNILPGVILVEMMNLTGLALDLFDQGTIRLVAFRGLDDLVIRGAVAAGITPGTVLVAEAVREPARGGLLRAAVKVYQGAEYLNPERDRSKSLKPIAKAVISGAVLPTAT